MIRRWWEWLHWDRRHHHSFSQWSIGNGGADWPPGTRGPAMMRRRCVCGEEQTKNIMLVIE